MRAWLYRPGQQAVQLRSSSTPFALHASISEIDALWAAALEPGPLLRACEPASQWASHPASYYNPLLRASQPASPLPNRPPAES
jgi:hypothetical protein